MTKKKYIIFMSSKISFPKKKKKAGMLAFEKYVLHHLALILYTHFFPTSRYNLPRTVVSKVYWAKKSPGQFTKMQIVQLYYHSFCFSSSRVELKFEFLASYQVTLMKPVQGSPMENTWGKTMRTPSFCHCINYIQTNKKHNLNIKSI